LPSGGWKITSFEATRVPGHKVKEQQISPIPSTPLTTPQPRFKLN
jgi:hypothetical protein